MTATAHHLADLPGARVDVPESTTERTRRHTLAGRMLDDALELINLAHELAPDLPPPVLPAWLVARRVT